MLTKLYVSAQVALPDWARGRGLAVFLIFIFGATTAGSAVGGNCPPGRVADWHFVAAAGLVLAIPMTWRWKLQTGVGIDFSPAMHWRAPIVARKVENNQGPVVAVVEYRVQPQRSGRVPERGRRAWIRAKAQRRLCVGSL